MLGRLKPSSALPLARSIHVSIGRSASAPTKNSKDLFKEINRLARTGKWDAINNSPPMFIFGQGKVEANAAYTKLVQPEDAFYKYGGQPFGPWIYLFSGIATFSLLVLVGCKGYEFIVPEKYRLHYKYKPVHHHKEHHGDEH